MNGYCSIEGCEKTTKARGLCSMHYGRWWAHGSPHTILRKLSKAGEPQLFIDQLPSTGTGCIFWPYASNGEGYGQINVKGRKLLAHRIVCERTNGAPPSTNHFACHTCGNGHLGCVSPWHLEWKTPKQNSADMEAHGTRARGEDVKNSKLTVSDIRSIRSMGSELSQSKIALRFGVSQTAIGKVLRRETWAHVDDGEAA